MSSNPSLPVEILGKSSGSLFWAVLDVLIIE
jgi:hypothetical protein